MLTRYCICGAANKYDVDLPRFCNGCGQSFETASKPVVSSAPAATSVSKAAAPAPKTILLPNGKTFVIEPDIEDDEEKAKELPHITKIELEGDPLENHQSDVVTVGSVIGTGRSEPPRQQGKVTKKQMKATMAEFKKESVALRPKVNSRTASLK